jgi:hypothetical protein
VVPVTAILAPVDWDQAVGNVVNDVTVLWGSTSPQAEVTLRADASYAQFGRRHATISTSLALEDDATIFAQLVLAHWAQPAWDAPQISVPMGTITDALWKALMGLNLGQVLLTDGVSSTPSTPTGQGRWLVEGWRDEYDRDDSGLLRHTLQFAVSDYDRWTASGQLGTTTTAVAAPTTAPYGTPITVTATVKDENGTLVAAGGGTVEVYDGATLLGTAALGALGTAAVPVTPPTGARTLVARYSGDTGHEGSQGSVPVTVTAVTTATVVLAVSDADVNLGQSTKFTATVTPSTAPGTIEFSYTRDGGAWTVWTGQDVPVVAGKGTATWTPGGAGHDYVWRARYVPAAGEPYNSPISNTVAVVVRQKVTHVRTFGATWSASFQQDGDKRSDTSDCYQGYYSGTNGNQKALAGFANPWPSGETVTKVRVRITTPHWNSASGGTLVLGSDDATAEPGSWPSGVNTDRLRTSMERGQTKWIDVTSWGTGWRALAFGPGPSTSSTYYGYSEGAGTDEPQVEVTSYEWA